jgi:Fungal specific transcription factor domain
LGLVATADEPNPSINTAPQVHGIEGWTNVTTDLAFVDHLLKLYFTWQHPFYVLFKEANFRHDFQTGRTKYCSALLVNAICAYACHYSDLPAARKNPEDPKTAGDHFFAEARELLFNNESSSLTTCQALAIMSVREASAARADSGFQYAGRSVRMAIELGLQLPVVEEWRQQLTDQEVDVRKSTFWGLFTHDT